MGGTENQIKDSTEGRASAKDEKSFVFEYIRRELNNSVDQVNDTEYGQKAGRRLGVAIMVTPLALFSKKRKHYLSIGWKDERDEQDKQHAAIFELGKAVVRTTLATIEARTERAGRSSGRRARKSGMGRS